MLAKLQKLAKRERRSVSAEVEIALEGLFKGSMSNNKLEKGKG